MKLSKAVTADPINRPSGGIPGRPEATSPTPLADGAVAPAGDEDARSRHPCGARLRRRSQLDRADFDDHPAVQALSPSLSDACWRKFSGRSSARARAGDADALVIEKRGARHRGRKLSDDLVMDAGREISALAYRRRKVDVGFD